MKEKDGEIKKAPGGGNRKGAGDGTSGAAGLLALSIAQSSQTALTNLLTFWGGLDGKHDL